ncbi:MAG: VanZ family protein [Burkholderiales bacterium]|nr:VanZ family protein [Burkholderiales bacterium]
MRIFAFSGLRRWWIAAGVLIVAAIWIGSLMPAPPRMPGGDKIHHFAAYALCSFFWCALATRLRDKVMCVIGVALMGVLIEFLQGVSGLRHFESADMIANALGALTGGVFTLLIPRTLYSPTAVSSTSTAP